MTIGELIARWRVDSDLSQAELARMLGVTQAWVSDVETNKAVNPLARPDITNKLARLMGEPLIELLALAGFEVGIEDLPPAQVARICKDTPLTTYLRLHYGLSAEDASQMASGMEQIFNVARVQSEARSRPRSGPVPASGVGADKSVEDRRTTPH